MQAIALAPTGMIANGMPKSPDKSGSKSAGGARALKVRVRTARKRTLSSARWLERQLNDPYVAAAEARRATGPAPPTSSSRSTTNITC